MRISKKAEYALRAALGIARAGAGASLQINELSRKEGIPPKFLEQILLLLKRAGILRSKRGVGGGYQLERTADKISLGEIIELADGPFMPVSSDDEAWTTLSAGAGTGASAGKGRGARSGLGRVFAELREDISARLRAISLQDVLAMEPKGDEAVSFDI